MPIVCCLDWNSFITTIALIISTFACVVACITCIDTRKMVNIASEDSKRNNKIADLTIEDFKRKNEINVQITDCTYQFSTVGPFIGMAIQIYNHGRTLYFPTAKMIIRKGYESYNFDFEPTAFFQSNDILKKGPEVFYHGMILNYKINFIPTMSLEMSYNVIKSLMTGDYQIEYKIFSQGIEVYSIIAYGHDPEPEDSHMDTSHLEALKPWERPLAETIHNVYLQTQCFTEMFFEQMDVMLRYLKSSQIGF